MMGLGFGGLSIFGRRNQAGFVGAYDAIPSIAAAYSSRRLRTAYTGSLLRLRRSSDNTESDIGYTADGDLDTAAVAAFVGGGSGYIVNWYDQSSNGYNATQTTAASQPLYVASGQNGRPVVRFDGSNDYLTYPLWLFPNAGSIQSVARRIGGTRTVVFVADNTDSPEIRFSMDSMQIYDGGAYQSVLTGDNVLNQWYVSLGVFAANLSEYRQNGTSKGTDNTVSINVDGNPNRNIGAYLRPGWYSNLEIAELIICNAALSDANRQLTEQAAADYWGITLS